MVKASHGIYILLIFLLLGLWIQREESFRNKERRLEAALTAQRESAMNKNSLITELYDFKNSHSDKPSEWVNPYRCNNPEDDTIYTNDKRFYIGRYSDDNYRLLTVCNSETKAGVGEPISRSQFKNIMFFTYNSNDGTKNALFKYDLAKKELLYIDQLDFKGRRYSGAYIAPNEEDTNLWSPDGKYAIIGVSPCWGCDPGDGVLTYVFNTTTDEFTALGNGVFDPVWVDNKTLRWDKYTFEERTEPDEYDIPGVPGYGWTWVKQNTNTTVLQ